MIQEKAIRILTDSDYFAHCKPLSIETKILTVVNLYIYLSLNYIKIYLNEFEVRHTCNNTRQQNNLDIPFCRLSKTSNSQIVIRLKLFNKLHLSVREMSNIYFKKKLYNWFGGTSFL